MRGPLPVAVAAALLLVTAGCISAPPQDDGADAGTHDPAPTFDLYPLPDPITDLEARTALDLGGGGNGIWIDEERHLLFSSNGGAGFHVVDISDPERPSALGVIPDDYARDVDILRWQNHTYAVLAQGSGILVVDTTTPTDPMVIASATEYGAHNLASIPGTPYVYSSSGFLPEKLIPVLDLSDPHAHKWHVIEIPLTVNDQPVQSDGCHDIVVRADLARAYCAGGGSFYTAGGGETLIMDITDPLAPEFIGIIDNPSIMYHHQALASADGSLLFINDEFLAPNCQGADLPIVGSRGQTTAAMWVYDISDPALPVLRSWVQPGVGPTEQVNCGSHFGSLIEDTGFLVWGWYDGGTLLIDVNDPDAPRIVARHAPSGSTWDAHYFNGHVYGSAGMLDVFRVV